ncbi:MAG: hypothetical protein HY978_04320 [Candidatus Liptonbacteria bacterium]|nr:hypothetical protein [Candidatus Liptonbacteria bacterium]
MNSFTAVNRLLAFYPPRPCSFSTAKKIASEILARLRAEPVPKKFLAGVLIGDDPASVSFRKIKQRTAEKLDVD